MDVDDQSSLLRQLMQRANITSYRDLGRQAGVSRWQINQLRQGKVGQLRLQPLLQISQTLGVSLAELIQTLAPSMASSAQAFQASIDLQPDDATRIEALTQEYVHLQAQQQQQQATLTEKFRRDSLQRLESWLTYWPSATHAVQQQPSAVSPETLIRLVRPVELLMADWDVQAIGTVGETVTFDPQQHQLVSGTAQPGESVRIKTVGYRLGDKLLFRAKCVVT